MSDDRAVRVVCTDRGTHPSREIAVLRLREPEENPGLLAQLRSHLTAERAEKLYAVEILDQTIRPDRSGLRRRDHGQEPEPGEGGSRGRVKEMYRTEEELSRWRFRCPTCRRDLQLKHPTAARLIDRICTAYPDVPLPAVDISLLPANLG
jgi:hypothetical protein